MADILEQGKWALLTVVLFLASLAARRALRLGKNLANLSGRGLLACIVLFASSNAGLQHHGWTILRGAPADSLQGLWAMFVGDALGALAVCYAARLLLA